jgi:hypothetical protein
MLHRDGALTDLEVAIIADHRISLGLAGYVFSRTPGGPAAPDGTPRQYGTGYGGVLFRYATYSNLPIYASIGALVGGGVLSLYSSNYHTHSHESDSSGDDWQYNSENEGFFVFQPDVSLHVNATRWMRFSLTGGYRMATAVHRFGYDAKSLGGGFAGGSIDLGWF